MTTAATNDPRVQERVDQWTVVLKTVLDGDVAAVDAALVTATKIPGSDRSAFLVAVRLLSKRLDRLRGDVTALQGGERTTTWRDRNAEEARLMEARAWSFGHGSVRAAGARDRPDQHRSRVPLF
jgi:hypothetical protein